MSEERDWDAEFAAITADWEPPKESGPTLTSDRTDIRAVPQQERPVSKPVVISTPYSSSPSAQESPKSTSSAPIEDDESFIPPTPAPLNWSDPSLVIMLAALVIGPMWLGFLLFWDSDSSLLAWSGAAGITFLGFVLAVARQPRSRKDQPDDDDGARI